MNIEIMSKCLEGNDADKTVARSKKEPNGKTSYK